MHKLKHLIALAAIAGSLSYAAAQRDIMDLSGKWSFGLTRSATTDSVFLPGTMDTNRKGTVNDNYDETTQLSRKFTYSGPAYYSKTVTIPKSWRNKSIALTLERTRPSTVWVDGKRIGSCSYLSTAHRYDLSKALAPGRHTITVMVDNGDSIPSQIKSNSHACTESTQTNWNGILGCINLEATSPLNIVSLKTVPDAKSRTVNITAQISDPSLVKGKQTLVLTAGNHRKVLKLSKDKAIYSTSIQMGDTARLWSEWSPVRHLVSASIPGHDSRSVKVGLRDFRTGDHHFYVNDTLTFLRGTHDGCVFPLTGYAPMDVESWRQYFRTIKEYGLNHVRFHSWCPPEACFEAADIEGIYLQPELPVWGGFNDEEKELMDFLLADGEAIQRQYSAHPSFVLFALGNELWGEVPVMQRFVNRFREMDRQHLYTYGTNAYLGWQGNLPGQDFFVTCRVGGGDGYSAHARASFSFADADEGGYLNNTYPGTERNFEGAVLRSPVPVIGHETGQFQIYPDYSEMKKYTGVLEPRNFAVFKKRLEDAGMASQARDFFNASGQWAARLYLADMEMNLRTPSMGGFQLLDIKDYPGQGTALVGILDAFMDSKGLITPEQWRRSCDEIVALAEFPSYCLVEGDNFAARLAVANYSGHTLEGARLNWRLVDGKVTIAQGQSSLPDGQGYIDVDSITVQLPVTDRAHKVELQISIPDRRITNSYPLWIYPEDRSYERGDVMLATTPDDAMAECLNNGGKVLLAPSRELVDSVTVGGLFQTDYWNYRMFKTISENAGKKVSPGTLGILTAPAHKALSQYPTEEHSDWQWYTVVKHSYPLILDRLNAIDYRPTVQVIDNVERNHRLGLLMEFKVGKGKLMLLMADIKELEAKPEGQQFIKSVIDYMNTSDFAPATAIEYDDLRSLLTEPSASASISTLRNISYD